MNALYVCNDDLQYPILSSSLNNQKMSIDDHGAHVIF